MSQLNTGGRVWSPTGGVFGFGVRIAQRGRSTAR